MGGEDNRGRRVNPGPGNMIGEFGRDAYWLDFWVRYAISNFIVRTTLLNVSPAGKAPLSLIVSVPIPPVSVNVTGPSLPPVISFSGLALKDAAVGVSAIGVYTLTFPLSVAVMFSASAASGKASVLVR